LLLQVVAFVMAEQGVGVPEHVDVAAVHVHPAAWQYV
jgi:hypothetical protein